MGHASAFAVVTALFVAPTAISLGCSGGTGGGGGANDGDASRNEDSASREGAADDSSDVTTTDAHTGEREAGVNDSGDSGSSDGGVTTGVFPYQSVAVVAWGGVDNYGPGGTGLELIDSIASLGARDITFQTISDVSGSGAFDSALDDATYYASIKQALVYAKSKGLRITLKPHVHTNGSVLQVASWVPSDPTSFFDSVEHNVQRHVQLATDAVGQDAYMLIVGTEMGGYLSGNLHKMGAYDNCAKWHSIIAGLRIAAPKTLLTYAATLASQWNYAESNEATRVCFWDALDFAGFDAYPYMNDIADGSTSTDFYNRMFDNGATIASGGDDGTADPIFSLTSFSSSYHMTNQSQVAYIEFVLAGIRTLTGHSNMRAVLTEIGTPSTDDALKYWGEPGSTNVNQVMQANGWEGAMKALSTLQVIEGISLWSEEPFHAASDTTNSTWLHDYDVIGKPAGSVICRWYSLNSGRACP